MGPAILNSCCGCAAHIFFDDAYQAHGDEDFEYTVNNFVKQLVRVVDIAARSASIQWDNLHISSLFSGRGDFCLRVNMSSDSIPPKLLRMRV